LEERVVVVVMGRVVELGKLLWEAVAGVEQELLQIHELEMEAAEAVEELKVHVPILEVKVLVGAVVQTQLETERSLSCD
jgi:hypothetical protein